MARSDLHPSQRPASSYSYISCKPSAAETASLAQPFAAPADPHIPAAMTKPLYDQPPAATDGAFYPMYPDFYDTSGMEYSAAAAAPGQSHPEVPDSSDTNIHYPPGWDYGMFDVQMRYPILSPETIHGDGSVLEPSAPWGYGAQAYQALVHTTMSDASAVADPMSQYVSVEQPAMTESMSHQTSAEESTNGCYDSLGWPQPPPMGQISPSPSQSSYYTSSPSSTAGARHSWRNSSSSLPAARVAALEQTRIDERLRPVPDGAASPDEGRFTPGGLRKGADSYAGQVMPRWGGPPRRTTTTTTTTTDHYAGTVSPVMTPSPVGTHAAMSSQPATQGSRNPPNQQTSKTNKRKGNTPATVRQTTKQKQTQADGRSQGQQQQEERQRDSQAGTHAKGQGAARPKQPVERHRNRDAANKCRAKTKAAAADLEATERAMGSEHRELSATARGLRDEVLMLKNELLAHGGCDDGLIQQYLTNQARRVGYGAGQPEHQQQQQQQHQHR